MRPCSKSMLLAPVWAVLVLGQSGGTAQTEEQEYPPVTADTPRHTLSGKVVNGVTGEPIQRALVTAYGPRPFSLFTDPNGRFALAAAPDGHYVLYAKRPGFVDRHPGEGDFWYASQNGHAEFDFDATVTEVVLTLDPEARIEVRVLDEDGEPVSRVAVELLSEQIAEGRADWRLSASGDTDENGHLEICDLRAGAYALHTLAAGAPSVRMADGGVQSNAYGSRYEPPAANLAGLSPLELKAGEDLPLTLTLSAAPAFTVSGTITGDRTATAVVAEDEDGQPQAAQSTLDTKTGKFTLAGLSAGTWVVHASAGIEQGPEQEGASAVVEVKGADVEGIPLRLAPIASVPVESEGGSEEQVKRLSLSLVAIGRTLGSRVMAEGDQPGSLAFRNLQPGSYRMDVAGTDTTCVAAITTGSRDLLREDLKIVPGVQPGPIQVIFRDDCGSITGTVGAPDQAVNGSVVVTSESASGARAYTLPSNGQFAIKNLAPGTYHLFAFSNMANLEYGNPDAMRRYASQEVTVEPNEQSTVKLPLTVREK